MKYKFKFFEIITLATAAIFVTACELDFDNNLDAPTDVVATLLTNNNIHITWSSVSGAQGYWVSYRTNLDSSDTNRSAGRSDTTAFIHYHYYMSNITDAATLYYYVKAYDSNNNESGYSSPVSVNIK